MKEVFNSKAMRAALIVIGGAAVLFVTFGFGVAVGRYHAAFESQFGANYYRNFPIHGVTGTVIDVSTSTISVTDPMNNERSIAVSSGTVFRDRDETIDADGVKVGDRITVIGEPGPNGQINARFVRVFEQGP